MTIRPLAAFTALLLSAPALAGAAPYLIDPEHSFLGFEVTHYFTPVRGRFDSFSGVIHFDPDDPTKCSVEVSIAAGSVDTGVDKRDQHLRSAEFLDAGRVAAITYVSKSWKAAGKRKYTVEGELTILEKSAPVTLEVTFQGEGPDRSGDTIAGWTATASFERSAFGVDYGLPQVGDEVTVAIGIEAGKQ